MSGTKDHRVIEGRKARNQRVCKRFNELYTGGYRYEVVIEKLIAEFGLAENTIYQIVKGIGYYKKEDEQ